MPNVPTRKMLIVGSGPVSIGRSGALDQAARCACAISRRAGWQTIMVHCDPSALSADPDVADRTYMVPLTTATLTEIVLREKPDAVFAGAGGPAASALVKACVRSGLLGDRRVRLVGLSAGALDLADDPSALSRMAAACGLAGPTGRACGSLSEAAAAAEELGYPVFVRVVEPDGSLRHGTVYNIEELRLLGLGGRLPADSGMDLRVEQALVGHREIELILLRDRGNAMRVAAMAENMDPVGVHSGDSIAAVPPLTLDEQTRRRMEAAACALAEAIGAAGVLHFKFAVGPDGQVLILSVNPWFTGMAAFCGRAIGLDLAAVHAQLGLGGELAAIMTDPAPTVAVRLPRWEFDRFPGEPVCLDARMKSTGEVMGFGRHLMEALLNAMVSRPPHHSLVADRAGSPSPSLDDLMRELVTPSPERIDRIHEALKKGADPRSVAAAAGIDLPWIAPLAELVALEQRLSGWDGRSLSKDLIDAVTAAGLNPSDMPVLLGQKRDAVLQMLADAGVKRNPQPAGGVGRDRTWFTATTVGKHAHAPMNKMVLIVGPGTGRIGQTIELDHCCVHAAEALHAAGRQVALVNANGVAAHGLDDVDRTYIAPLTTADLLSICRSAEPEGVILQFGGYAAMNLAPQLVDAGFAVLGTDHASVDLTQDRLRFSRRLTELGIPHPAIGAADSPEQAMDAAETIGYPLVVTRPTDHPIGVPTVVRDAPTMEQHLMRVPVSPATPMLLEQFLEYAIEVETDALCDGEAVYVPAVMEHIELAGVHSGDAAMVVPPYSTPPRHVDTVSAYVHKVARELRIHGLINTRFAVYNDTVYLLTVRPWGCRTLPAISKICNVPMARRAVEIMLGGYLEAMDLPRRLLPHYAVRSSVFPFGTFTETDPLLGPRMRSTGQAMVLANGFGMAYFTSQEAAGPSLPLSGDVLITVTDADKPSILEPARLFKEMGFGIRATRGTCAFLQQNGIAARLVKKLGFGRPDLVDAIKTGEITLVVNTPSGTQSQHDDAHIRKTAIRYRIPNITTPAAALAAAKGIAARKQGQEALATLQAYGRALR